MVGDKKTKRIKFHNNRVDGKLIMLGKLQKVVGANNLVGEIKHLKNKKKEKLKRIEEERSPTHHLQPRDLDQIP